MQEELKAFSVLIPRELWRYLKNRAVMQDKTLREILTKIIENDRKTCEKRLANRANNVNM